MMRTVIKLGGSVLVDAALRQKLIAQIGELKREGFELILVHGGGKQIAALLSQLKIESRFHDGLRITDKAARDVVQMVLAGQVGKDLVAELAKVDRRGAPPIPWLRRNHPLNRLLGRMRARAARNGRTRPADVES